MILCSLRRLKEYKVSRRRRHNVLSMKALVCPIFIIKDFFDLSFGDELDNVVNGLDHKALAEVICELTPRLGARLVLKVIHHDIVC